MCGVAEIPCSATTPTSCLSTLICWLLQSWSQGGGRHAGPRAPGDKAPSLGPMSPSSQLLHLLPRDRGGLCPACHLLSA
ncbi:hypothetical protein Cadr_000018453 [Camelus dromedarius]|uniref:Uncharacterized protein n=1 Tax=Camelus dromedarius TaxID=9838 RepID=A0A5N4D4H7_CAMDR|nr:hypothetical protein Cadr_000018453 [Camelus dromedarius]